MSGLRFEHYHVGNRCESLVRHGPEGEPAVLVLLPFFHEHDRLRRFAGSLMRALAEHGLASACPDRPGENESIEPLPSPLASWRESAEAAARAVAATATLSIRSGAILDQVLSPARRYRFAPATGGALVRDLKRAAALADAESGRTADANGNIALGGRVASAGLLASLAGAEPAAEAGRTVRLDGDARPADLRIAGDLLWRRAEPGDDPALAAGIAADFTAWHRACVAT